MGFDIDFSDLTRLTDALDDVKKILTSGFADDTFDEMVKESKKAKKGVDDVKKSVNGIDPGGVDEVSKGLSETEKNGKKAHKPLEKIDKLKFNKAASGLNKLTSSLKKVGIAAGKMLAGGIAAGVAGVGTLVTKSITNYADYEQLVGGVETLFKDSAGTVQKYADDAFKTAGLSANDYMETVTSFSASLIQSLGGDTGAAAEYANMAITDMSDNANKMGTDVGSLQDAYSGFAKQNYTMLDNLKLGYGGTKEEMQRLLDHASKLPGALGKKFDISNYADIVEAIHLVQEEMGITGTTSKEASETISGSAAAMKAAWSNTMTSLVLGGDDFDRCVDNLVESAKTFGKNIMPAILSALDGVGDLITALAPEIESNLPTIIDKLLPPLITAATALLKGVIIALPGIISTLVGELPEVLQQVWDGIATAFGDVPGIDKVGSFFKSLNSIITENTALIQKLIPVAIGLVVAMKLFNKIKIVSGLFSFGGKGGKSKDGFFSSLANMNVSTILKGFGNLAIIIGGLSTLAALLMWAAPYMAKLSDMKSIAEVLTVITLVGLVGTGMTKLAAYVGNIPVATVAKGLADIAIALVGFGALAAALMWLAPYMAQLSDMQTTIKILLIIGTVGIIGSALAGLAGAVGMIPIATVLTGLGNVALALGGFTAIIEAFGLLSDIPGFNDFLTSGGTVLVTICNILGSMIGSVIGGLGEGITNSLPAIGDNLSSFATSIQPMFATFSGIDSDGLSKFAGSLSALIGVLAGEKILSIITGGINYKELGSNLSAMATNLSGFFSTIMGFPEGSFEKASALFECLAGISSVPKDGGVVGWFEGEVDYQKMSNGLLYLSKTVGFFAAVEGISDTAFANAGKLFECLAGIKSLPDDGGVVGWFEGEVNFDKIASGIQSLVSPEMVSALSTISSLPENTFTSLSAMFNTLSGINSMPNEGGIAGWFTGDNSTAIANVANQLPTVATAISSFLTNLGGVTDFTPITSLFTALSGIKSMPSEGGIFGWFTGDGTTGLTNVSSKLPGVATDIAAFFTNLGGRTDFTPIASLFDTLSNIKVGTDAANGTGLFGWGASQLETIGAGLGKFADNSASFFTLIGDKKDFSGIKSLFNNLTNIDVGTDAANGTGLFGWGASKLETIGAGLGTFATKAESFFTSINKLSIEKLSGFFEQLGKVGDIPTQLEGIDGKIATALDNILKDTETKFTSIKESVETGMKNIIAAVDAEKSNMETSGGNIMDGLKTGMENKLSSLIAAAKSIASAVTKAYNDALDINSPSKVMIESGEYTVMGAIVGMRNMIPDVKATSYDLATATMPYIGSYSPDSDSSTIYNNGGNSEYTTISPVFNLTISGTHDDRVTARRVKQYVAEAIKETFESLERKTCAVREV